MALDLLPGHRLTLLRNGAEFFPALQQSIREASREIHLESYIFADDSIGRMTCEALVDAARRGVQVRILVDGYGSPEFEASLRENLEAGGVMAMVYRPDKARFSFRRHRLRRLHRKLALIDERIAFVGGINIIDDRDDGRLPAPRLDFAVRIEGPLLAMIHRSMHRLWEITAWAKFRRRVHDPRPCCDEPPASGTQRAAFLLRDNLRHRRTIERAYLAAILSARDEIVIANAYFLPGRRFRQALIRAARRGVSISLLLQGRVEYRLQHYATQALYGQLLDAGIRIFEYRRSFLHAKVAVVDDSWATVGSSNIDPFSLLLAKEANVVTSDKAFAVELRDSLTQAIREGASELPSSHWKKQPWYWRLLCALSLALVRLAVVVTGYGNRH